MVKLRLRKLAVIVETVAGEYRVDLPFEDGLVVVRAENSRGKSTLVQSIIYALGMEGMLSASRAVPLPHSMTHRIDDDDGTKHDVTSSRVQLEFENHAMQVVTVVRHAKGSANLNLVTVIHGPALTGPKPASPYAVEDMFVRDGGAATSPAGFHFWLAAFLGWRLPMVTKFDGKDCPLYMECSFPLMLVEQKKAWAGIQARMPTHLGIRDVAKRAVEFVLSFSVFEHLARRQQLRDEMSRLLGQWQQYCLDASTSARMAGGMINGLTAKPVTEWQKDEQVALVILRQGEWKTVMQVIEQDKLEIQRLSEQQIPEVSAVTDQLTAGLRDAEDELVTLHVTMSDLGQEIQVKRSQLAALDLRLSELAEDLQGNKAVRKLRNMGSKHGPKSIATNQCPTCHQGVDDTILPQINRDRVQTIDESIAFIETQQKIFQASKLGITRAMAVIEAEMAALREREIELRARIRELKTSLVSEGHAPSRAAIEALLSAQSRLKRTQDAEVETAKAFDALMAICPQWSKVSSELKALPEDDLSDEDEKKLQVLEKLFQEHALAFGVSSVDPTEIKLSRENYKPQHEGFDLDFDVSASDLIRTIWAYLHSLLELSRIHPTNHLGLLVMDEPRQQDTNRQSLARFYQRAQHAKDAGQQVIVTTSESRETIHETLANVNHTLLELGLGYVLRPKAELPISDKDETQPANTSESDSLTEKKEVAGEDDEIPF